MPSQAEASGPLARRPLGSTGLQVTPICIGAAPMGSMPETFAYSVPEERAVATIRAFFAGPFNFLDTAASYGDGESERRIGIVLREIGGVPPGFVLATKADRDLQTGVFTGAQMRRSVERSLRLLGLEQLQLVHLHDPEHISFEEAISHNRFTLLNKKAEPFWEVCVRRGVAVLNAAPYGSGILAKGPGAYPRYMYNQASPDLLRRARQMEEACERHGLPLAAAALQFSLREVRIASTIVGITRPERLTETLKLARQPIPDELWAELDSIYRS